MKSIDKQLQQTGIIPVVKIDDPKRAVPMAKALSDGGINAVEITFRTSAAAKSIELIAKEMPDILLCAGTILGPEQANIAVACGAKAVISPGTNPLVVKWCLENDVPVYPGCATPSEVETAMSFGLTSLKLFPADVVGGINMLKALYGPYAGIKFMPTGGITAQSAYDYLILPNVLACGGSWICSPDLLNSGNYLAITQNALEARSIVEKVLSSI